MRSVTRSAGPVKQKALEPDTPTCCSCLCTFLLVILTMLQLSTLISLEYDMTVFCNFNDTDGACSTYTRKFEVYVKHEGGNFHGRTVSG